MDFERVSQRLNGSLGRVWPLEGGVSARTTAIEVGRRTYVVREHANATLEFRLLQVLADTGIPVPPPRLLDEAGAYLVTNYVESDPPPPPADVANALAAALVEIHGHPDNRPHATARNSAVTAATSNNTNAVRKFVPLVVSGSMGRLRYV